MQKRDSSKDMEIAHEIKEKGLGYIGNNVAPEVLPNCLVRVKGCTTNKSSNYFTIILMIQILGREHLIGQLGSYGCPFGWGWWHLLVNRYTRRGEVACQKLGSFTKLRLDRCWAVRKLKDYIRIRWDQRFSPLMPTCVRLWPGSQNVWDLGKGWCWV